METIIGERESNEKKRRTVVYFPRHGRKFHGFIKHIFNRF